MIGNMRELLFIIMLSVGMWVCNVWDAIIKKKPNNHRQNY